MGGDVGVNSEVEREHILVHGAAWQRCAFIAACCRPDLRGRRVLIIDDNSQARAVLSSMLTSMTFVVHEAPSGLEGVEMVRQAANRRAIRDCVRRLADAGNRWDRNGQADSRAAKSYSPAATGDGHSIWPRRGFETGGEQRVRERLIKPVTPSMLFDSAIEASATDQQKVLDVPARPSQDLAQLRGARVLLVEDNELNHEVAMGLLEDAHIAIELAENGEVAVRMVSENKYDIVLMDMQMPVMDGIAATKAIRSNRNHRYP